MADAAMIRRVLTVLAWTLAVILLLVYVGLRVRSHRQADPVQGLRPYLVWLPDDLAAHADVVGRHAGKDGLSLQVELHAAPGAIRAFAARNRMEPVEGALFNSAADRWQMECPGHPGAVVHLLLAEQGGNALLTVLDPAVRE